MTNAGAAQAVSRLLRLDSQLAGAIVARAEHARADLKHQLHQQMSVGRGWVRGFQSLSPRVEGTAVIGLAFSRRSLLWLQKFSLASARPLLILHTELSESHFREHARCYGPLQLLTPIEMIRHQSNLGVDRVFVTFPDHTVGNGNTNVQAPMFGESMLFHALESLLARKHHANMYCFYGDRLSRWVPESAPAGIGEICLIAEAAWLAANIEFTISSAPEEYFGWGQIERKSMRRSQDLRRMRLDVLKGFLRAWAWRAMKCPEGIDEIIRQIDRDGPALVESEINAGLRLSGS